MPQVLGNMLRVRFMVAQYVAKHDEERVYEYLCAAARGDAEYVAKVGKLPPP